MIQTKIFHGYYKYVGKTTVYRRWVDIDEQINEFLKENDVELIDIKFSAFDYHDDLQSSALLIYKTI